MTVLVRTVLVIILIVAAFAVLQVIVGTPF